MQNGGTKFHLILIKPTHYDDDGYPIQWLRSAISSNTLACLNGLAEDCRRRQALGPNVDMVISAFDEKTNRRVQPAKIAKTIEPGDKALVAFAGVQSNQFRAPSMLRASFGSWASLFVWGDFMFRAACRCFPNSPPILRPRRSSASACSRAKLRMAGLDIVLKDAFEGILKPLYNFMADLPDMTNQPMPILPLNAVRRTIGITTSVDLGRGCPYQCSFCTIINGSGAQEPLSLGR